MASGVSSDHPAGDSPSPAEDVCWEGGSPNRSSFAEPGTGLEQFPTGKKKMFVDQDAMKTKLRERMSKPAYDVTNFYHTTGRAQKIARSTVFEVTTLAVIAFNAIWISVDTDWNTAASLLQAHWVFQVAENLFCAYFFGEWLTRFLSFKRKLNGLRDGWFVFDSLLVGLMVFETWIMTAFILIMGGGGAGGLGNASIMRMARLLRLTRMARMARLLRSMPELMILVRGMAAATRSVIFTLMLLIVFLYVFSILFVQICADSALGDEWFSTVPHAMHTLLIYGTFTDDLSTLAIDLQEKQPIMLAVFYMYVLLGSLTLLNMLVGVLCEVVTAVANTEKEAMTISYVRDVFLSILKETGMDANCDGQISKDEFISLFHNDQAIGLLEEVGVDVLGLVGISDFIFEGDAPGSKESTLTYDDLMKLILDLRGSNSATVRDIVDLRKYVRQQFSELKERSRTTTVDSSGTSQFQFPGECTSPMSAGNPLRELLEHTAEDLKKFVKEELRCQLGGTVRRSSSSNEKASIKMSLDEPYKVTATPYGEPNNLLKSDLDCIDISFKDDTTASPWSVADAGVGLERFANITGRDDLSPEEETLCNNGVSDLLARFQDDTREMQQHLAAMMERVDVLDVKLGSLTELVVPEGATTPRHTDSNSTDSPDDTDAGQSPSARPSELLHSLCSSRKEMQRNLECVMNKANDQHSRFALLSQLVVSIRRHTRATTTPEFFPQVARRRSRGAGKDNSRQRSDSDREKESAGVGCMGGAACS